jgi:hypothetical protein
MGEDFQRRCIRFALKPFFYFCQERQIYAMDGDDKVRRIEDGNLAGYFLDGICCSFSWIVKPRNDKRNIVEAFNFRKVAQFHAVTHGIGMQLELFGNFQQLFFFRVADVNPCQRTSSSGSNDDFFHCSKLMIDTLSCYKHQSPLSRALIHWEPVFQLLFYKFFVSDKSILSFYFKDINSLTEFSQV